MPKNYVAQHILMRSACTSCCWLMGPKAITRPVHWPQSFNLERKEEGWPYITVKVDTTDCFIIGRYTTPLNLWPPYHILERLIIMAVITSSVTQAINVGSLLSHYNDQCTHQPPIATASACLTSHYHSKCTHQPLGLQRQVLSLTSCITTTSALINL